MSENASAALELWRRLTDPDTEIVALKTVFEDYAEVPTVYPQLADLPDEAFSREKHRIVWQAIKTVQGAGGRADQNSVRVELQRSEQLERVGGVSWLFSFSDGAPRAGDVVQVRNRLMEMFGLRVYYRRMKDVLALIEAGETLEAVREFAIKTVTEADAATMDRGTLDPMEVTREAIREIELEMTGVGVGIRSGIEALDERLRGGGFLRGQLVYVGARPSRGKTSLLLKIAENAAAAGKRVLFFSLEMPGREIQKRRLIAEARLNMRAVTSGSYGVDAAMGRIAAAMGPVMQRSLLLTDNNERTATKIRSEAFRERLTRGLDMIVVDYLGYIDTPGRGTPYEKTTAASKALHNVALALDIPVVVGAQLNRGSETGGAKGKQRKPQLSDFRDSGAVEQDADIAVLIHQDGEENAIKGGPVELILAKQRNGWTGIVEAMFISEYATFTDLPVDARAADMTRGDDDNALD